jgi:Carboxypeptidase regulatory-like domain/TonB-dependent Receptor Plug Domain
MFRCVALFLSLLATIAPAQEVTGSISGSVTDPTGSAISGAAVKLINEQTAASRTVESDAEGNFTFAAVLPGIYTISAEHAGFKKFQKQQIELTPGGKMGVGALQLPVGSISESVTVLSEGSTVQTATSERAGIVTSEEIKDLTVINRDFAAFAELQPGILVNPGQEVQTFSGNTTFNALGGRTTGNNILIDGLPSSNTNQSNVNTSISLDATQTVEVKVSNFAAEYGRNQGVTIMAVSKGGSQQLHGSGYYYIRNEALNANNFFNNRAGIKETAYRISTAGGNLGGPVRIPGVHGTKGKLFFFVSSEEIRELRPKTAQTVTVPTLAERQGDFSASKVSSIKDPLGGVFPNKVIPANRILPVMQKYLNLLPEPNFFNTAISGGNYNYYYQESLKVPKRIETGRLDYNPTEKTTMWGRFNYWWEDQSGAAVSAGNSSWGWLPDHYTAITPSGVFAITHILSPTLILQATMGYSRFTEAGSPLSDAELQTRTRTATGINIPQFNPSVNPLNLVPAATFSGITNSANPSYASRFPLRGVENTFNWNGTINKTQGPHSLKAGVYIERWRALKGNNNASSFAGTMAFGSDSNNPNDTGYAYSNALLGEMASYTEVSSREATYEFVTSTEWYAQDSWKVSRGLTLDLGVRFGWGQPWHSLQNREAGFLPWLWDSKQTIKLVQPILSGGKRLALDPYTGAILPAVNIGAIAQGGGNPYNGIVNRLTNPDYPQGLRQTDGIKTAPRVGFAWDPFGRGKTVIRGGGGLFYSVHELDNYANSMQSTPPLQYNSQINYVNVSNFINSAGYLFPSSIQGFDPDRHIPRTTNFSFGFQQDVGHGTVIDVAYVGALGRHLQARRNLNTTALGTNYQPQYLDSTTNKVLPSQFVRPYVGYGDIQYYYYGTNSSYHSLQATMRRRYTRNLTYGVVYTFSKAMDYTDTDAGQISTVVDPKVWNYGRAGFDRTHIFRFYWNYNAPRLSTHLGNNRIARAILDEWQISGKLTLQSGAPQSITTSYSPSQDVTGSTDTGRPLLIADPVLPRDQQTGLLAFNTAAIATPPYAMCENANPSYLCWGNAPKDVYRGPGLNLWDTSLFKNFHLTERLRGQFRVEAYNVFNHTNFSTVDNAAKFDASGKQTNATLGQYTAAVFPRRLQLAMRLSF